MKEGGRQRQACRVDLIQIDSRCKEVTVSHMVAHPAWVVA